MFIFPVPIFRVVKTELINMPTLDFKKPLLTKYKLLRLLLLSAGLGWGLTIAGAFLPWEWATSHLEVFGGAEEIPDDVMLNYWMRMAAGAFGIVGFFFLLAAWKPYEYKNIIGILAYASLFEGAILVFYGLKLGLPLFPFGPDVAIALVPGIGILFLKHVLEEGNADLARVKGP